MASSAMKYKTREDAKRARELDEARKAGIAPPELDEETGQAINPHIPQYMTAAPWYLNQDKTSMKHQKDWRVKEKLAEKWYTRGAKGKANTKFKKGACEKCAPREPFACSCNTVTCSGLRCSDATNLTVFTLHLAIQVACVHHLVCMA